MQKCEDLAQELKSRSAPFNMQLFSRPLRDFMPPKQIADRLLQLYLQTFESVLRVLHVPTLQRDYEEYWNDPQEASEPVVLQILLILAIGTAFDRDAPSLGPGTRPTLHDQSTQWIHAAHIRVAAPFQKTQLDLRGVQTQCLLVLALLTNTDANGGDLTFITTASLVQGAMVIGLHLEPSQLPISTLEAEVRRRLWATLLELVVQASLDSGMPPVISTEALNSYELPSNIDDSQISESTKLLPASQPTTSFTQSSIQRALLRSLPIRFKIAEALNQVRSKLPYDSARRMGDELTSALRDTSKVMDSFLPRPPSAFPIQLQDLLQRRFLLQLHTPFAYKASSDVSHHFSRTVCLECSLLLLSASWSGHRGGRDGNSTPSASGDHTNLHLYGDGLFKNVFLVATLTVCAELLQQLCEDSSPAALSLSRCELLRLIEDGAILTRRRSLQGETSVKAHVFLSCLLAKSRSPGRLATSNDKTQTGQVLVDAAERALDGCCSLLESWLGYTVASRNSGPGMDVSPTAPIEYPRLPHGDACQNHGLGQRGGAASRRERCNSTVRLLDDGSQARSFSAWGNGLGLG